MEFLSSLSQIFSDARLDANLIGFSSVATIVMLGSLALRRLFAASHAPTPGYERWFHAAGAEAASRVRFLIGWVTAFLLLGIAGGGILFHVSGRDLRDALTAMQERWSGEDLAGYAVRFGGLVVLLAFGRFAQWFVRHISPMLESQSQAFAQPFQCTESVRGWFQLAERYASASIRLLVAWGMLALVGLASWAGPVATFLLSVSTILVGARLLTLSWHVGSKAFASLGGRHLEKGPFARYWERISRLFPFAERCFEAAVYVSAASLCMHQLTFIAFVADFGPRVVKCIGIVFGTRVLIELSQVLLNEAFGLHDDSRRVDQKGRTLVPLLHSMCQYTLYLGSGILMMGVLGIDTTPILAGAGIIGLAVGLGAQNLVTDVVSGFFILFENQYLVGDCVELGGACGTVEAVSIRLTQLRDDEGKLHIIPNGQIKSVVNYSKGYINAVVDVKVLPGSDVEGLFRAMTDAGRRLAQSRSEVLAETEIQGIVAWDTKEIVVRAVTKVQPGAHGAIQSEYRRMLKQILDQQQGSGSARRPAAVA